MNFKRSDRVGELIREEIAKIISQEIKDPRVGFVTVTGMDLSNDLRNMNVYFSVMGDKAAVQETACGLTSSAGFIRKLLGRRLYLKRVPELKFKIDRSIEFSERITEVLDEIKKEDEQD